MTRHSIDVAWFECVNCGHRSTPPESINAIPYQMEVIQRIPAEKASPDATLKSAEEAKHPANTISVITWAKQDPQDNAKIIPDYKEVRCARSYAKVGFQSGTLLEESNHIRLDCPNCNTVLYEVRW